jgi:hypothetical protein
MSLQIAVRNGDVVEGEGGVHQRCELMSDTPSGRVER